MLYQKSEQSWWFVIASQKMCKSRECRYENIIKRLKNWTRHLQIMLTEYDVILDMKIDIWWKHDKVDDAKHHWLCDRILSRFELEFSFNFTFSILYLFLFWVTTAARHENCYFFWCLYIIYSDTIITLFILRTSQVLTNRFSINHDRFIKFIWRWEQSICRYFYWQLFFSKQFKSHSKLWSELIAASITVVWQRQQQRNVARYLIINVRCYLFFDIKCYIFYSLHKLQTTAWTSKCRWEVRKKKKDKFWSSSSHEDHRSFFSCTWSQSEMNDIVKFQWQEHWSMHQESLWSWYQHWWNWMNNCLSEGKR